MAAALVAAIAGALLLRPPARLGRLEPAVQKPTVRPRAVALLGLAAAVGVGVVSGLEVLGWLAVAGIVLGTAGHLGIAARRRKEQAQRARDCATAARTLSSLLRAGQLPGAALAEAAADAPMLASAAGAARLGADVGAELERAAAVPGQSGMAALAAAWRVSERTGAPIADLLAEAAENLRRQRQFQALIDAELAAARASGQIMAGLPLFAVGLGFVAGADPVAFLLGGPLGQVLVFAAVTLTAAGVLWIDRLAQGKKVIA